MLISSGSVFPRFAGSPLRVSQADRPAGVLRVYPRVPVVPGRGLLELAGDPDEQVLPAIGGGQLHADRQAGGVQCRGRLMAGWPVMLNGAV